MGQSPLTSEAMGVDWSHPKRSIDAQDVHGSPGASHLMQCQFSLS